MAGDFIPHAVFFLPPKLLTDLEDKTKTDETVEVTVE